MRLVLLLFLIAALLTGCARTGSADATPTLSSEAVIQAAHVAAQQTRAAFVPSPTLPPPTPTVQATPSPTTEPTPESPIATAAYNANIRSGPGVEYERIDDFYQGQTAFIVGRHLNPLGETWWYVRRIGGGWDGWIWDGAVVIAGDVSLVPVLEPSQPPLSTPG